MIQQYMVFFKRRKIRPKRSTHIFYNENYRTGPLSQTQCTCLFQLDVFLLLRQTYLKELSSNHLGMVETWCMNNQTAKTAKTSQQFDLVLEWKLH